jgi:pimeloyl-ACP methyl ester carboxylesterase
MQRFTLPMAGGHLAGLNFGPTHGPIDLVFLHATGFNALTYRTLLEPLAPEWRVVALDLRGHGLTSLPAHPDRLTHWHGYARDVIQAIGQLAPAGTAPGLIAGHSMGGTVALLALAHRPQLAGALLLIDPAMVPTTWRRALLLPFAPRILRRRLPIARAAGRRRADFDSAEQALASYRGRGAFKTWKPGFLDDYVADGFGPAPGGGVRLRCAPAWEAATFAGHRHDTAAALRALRAPALLLAAGRNSTVGAMLPTIRACAPALVIEGLPQCSHFIPMEEPALVRDRMRALRRGS